MAEEKFISIEYNTWMSKYKPMEEENERLREELRRDKLKVDVFLSHHMAPGMDRPIGFFEVAGVSTGVRKFDWNARMEMESAVIDAAYQALRKNSIGNRYYVGKDEVQRASTDLEIKINQLMGLKIENDIRIARIPKLIKWIFKIKS